VNLRDRRILVTGATGQVAAPIARELARHNEVFALARFKREGDEERVRALGAQPVRGDLGRGELSEVPTDVDAVLHFAVVHSPEPRFDEDLTVNAEGTGLLMAHCREARAFLHCSSAAVYEPRGGAPARETDPLGEHHRGMFPTYSICKIASEAVARSAARQYQLPTTIARLGVPYGEFGGWPWFHLMMMKNGSPIPLHPEGANRFPLLHEDDYLSHLEGLLEMASVPATVVNWAGSEDTDIEQWCCCLGELTGLEPCFEKTEAALRPLPLDVTKLEERLGRTRVSWQDGLRRMVEARNPELLKKA